MPAPQVIRLSETEPDFEGSQVAQDIVQWLCTQWDRAVAARSDQVDHKYAAWQKNYDGTPAQTERILPWPGASNYVVQLSRMFIDTFVARSLNVVFATRPLYALDFLPNEVKNSVETYLNHKALVEWQHYWMTRSMMFRGAKNGTTVQKTMYVVDKEVDVRGSEYGSGAQEREVITYDGPKTEIIPFEDFYVYPITANRLRDAIIKFQRIRLVEEEAVRQAARRGWLVDEQTIRNACIMPPDIKRSQEQSSAGVSDPWLRELHLVECHFKYDPRRNGSYYSLIALVEPTSKKLYDIYYHPYDNNCELFQDYRPNPREDLFYGESWCQILAQSQEEASTIHNDRRNASYILNAPVFKRKSGSLLPNPSSNWYPGKVWDLDSMDDFEIVALGGSYNDMLAEENHIFMLAEKLVGIGAVMQGNAAGMMGKRGIYNAAGTLAVLSESNQRQDTNIRDIREVIGAIAKQSFLFQRQYGPNDPLIQAYASVQPKMAQEIQTGLQMAMPELIAKSFFDIKASDAGANSEVRKANMMQLAQVVGQYGQAVPQLATQAMSMENPLIKGLIMQVAQLHKWMAGQLLRTFGEYDAEQYLPDLNAAFQGGMAGTAPAGGPPASAETLQRGRGPDLNGAGIQQMLAGIQQVPLPPNGMGGGAGMGGY